MLKVSAWRLRAWALAWVVLAPATWAGNALNEAAKQQAHHVLCVIDEDHISAGSGFLIDQGRRLVTNWHVVECLGSAPPAGGRAGIMLADDRVIPLRLEWHSDRKDLAILKLETPMNAAVTFAGRQSLEERDKVIVAGFPGPALQIDHHVGQLSFTEGIISKFTEIGGVRYIQTSAPTHHGNSGGPLYDERGRVVGIMVAVATAELEGGQGQVIASGISYAILADELLEELERMGIAYPVARTREENPPANLAPAPPVGDRVPPVVWKAAVGLAAVLFLAAVHRVRRAEPQPGRDEPVPHASDPHRPRLRCLDGADAGSTVPLDREPLYLGRDARQCQWVMPRAAHRVSRRHCCLRWDGGRRVTLEDCGSANGTFLADGRRLPARQPAPLQPGDRFYLGNRDQQFQLDWDQP